MLFPVGLFLLDSALSRDLLPERWIENVPADDDSVRQCFVFRTQPGVIYRVESSPDLQSWTPGEEVYGLGNEFVTTMREFTPAPVTGSGGPPMPAYVAPTCVTLRMRRSNAAGGGLVFSWRSLDDGSAVNAALPLTASMDWDRVPFYCQRFGNYYFFFMCDLRYPVTAPAENPPLGVKDAAMFAQLEISFPAMAQEVQDSIERVRNAPPPPPPDPDGKKFWRVHCDWGVDTDGDGSPDWMEFEMAASGSGTLVSGVLADSFNADTNGDGILNGDQLDFDGDGVADAKDAGKEDPAATFELGPVPRYAVFPITNAQPFDRARQPVQMNDQGIVLYQNGTWAGGEWMPLAGSADRGDIGVQVRAAGMNDLGEIIGSQLGMLDSEGNAISSRKILGNLVWWPTRSATATALTVDGGHPWIGFLSAGLPAPHRGTLLCNDGKFLASNETAPNTDEDGNYILRDTGEKCLWTLPGTGRVAGRTPSPYAEGGILDAEHYWGYLQDGTHALTSNGVLIGVESGLDNLYIGPKEEIIGIERFSGRVQFYGDGEWNDSELLSPAVEISKEGIAIGRSHDGKTAPMLLNGKWTAIERYAPGISAPWKDTTVKHLDTTAGGWVLASRGSNETPEYAAMLPIKVDGVDNSATPANLEDLAAGVDRISMTALGGIGRVQEMWIMAPNGGGSNTVRFRSPLNGTSKLTLASNSKVEFSPEILDSSDKQIVVKGREVNTTQSLPTLKLGGTTNSISVPLMIKVMKKRTVKVAVHEVLGVDEHDRPVISNHVPDEGVMETHLNKVYGRQVNTFFDVTLYPENGPAGSGIDFDFSGEVNDRKLNVGLNDPELKAATPNAKAEGDGATENIDVWVVAGVGLLLNNKPVYGAHYGGPGVGKIIIDGNLMERVGADDEMERGFLYVLAHEIGHVMTGDGHPNEKQGAELRWKESPLPMVSKDPRDQARLMCSGEGMNWSKPGNQLIKKEWDLIEAWLNANIKDQEQ